MYEKELETIGLSPNEAKIYETLLKIGESGVTDIANKAQVHRRSVYDTLMRLIEKGLVFQIFESKENLYRATDPRKCLELLREKEKTFKRVLPGLEHFFKEDPGEEAAYIYRGFAGYKNYIRDLTSAAEDCYFLGAKANWLTPGSEIVTKEYFAAMKKNKKQIYTLFDPRVKDEYSAAEYKKIGGNFKFLPPKYATNGVMDVFGEYVVTFKSVAIGNFGEEGTIFIMRNRELADSYRIWFQCLWDLCPK